MIGSIRKNVRWQIGQTHRHVGKVGYADGDNNAVCADRLVPHHPTAGESPAATSPSLTTALLSHISSKLSLKGQTVRRERFEWYRNVYGLVWKPSASAPKTR